MVRLPEAPGADDGGSPGYNSAASSTMVKLVSQNETDYLSPATICLLSPAQTIN